MTSRYNKRKLSVRTLSAMVAIMLVLGAAGTAPAWNFTIPAIEIQPVDDAFVFPVSAFADGKARHFVYKRSPREWVRFFVVRSSDGVLRAAFDACDVCWKQKKGYVQEGDEMVCINCGMRFPSTKINEVKGGCNPAPLKRTVQGDKLVIKVADVLPGMRFFR